MSVRMISWAFQQKLSPTEKLVLIALADHANDEDFTCWPSLTHLVKKTSLCRKSVWKAIDKLVEKGYVKRVDDPSKRSTTYFLIGAHVTYTRFPDTMGQVPTSPGVGSHVTPNHNRTIIEPSDNRTSLLGEPNVSYVLEKQNPKITEALEVLQFLNDKTGRKYRGLDGNGKPTANLKLIMDRLKTGVSVQDCKTMIARKHTDWAKDDKMWPYLRPSTLFRASNFEQYLGECTTEERRYV